MREKTSGQLKSHGETKAELPPSLRDASECQWVDLSLLPASFSLSYFLSLPLPLSAPFSFLPFLFLPLFLFSLFFLFLFLCLSSSLCVSFLSLPLSFFVSFFSFSKSCSVELLSPFRTKEVCWDSVQEVHL